MISHENRLLADDFHEISYLYFYFLKMKKDVIKFVLSAGALRVTCLTSLSELV